MKDLADALEPLSAYPPADGRHGDLPRWQAAVSALPELCPSRAALCSPVIRLGDESDCDTVLRAALRRQLRRLMPWRKGPFDFFGVRIDSEWRSDLKWSRLAGRIAALPGRVVLDVGCGNGYFAWRMLGAGATAVLGLEPSPLFRLQCQAARRYLAQRPVFVLPLRLQAFAALQAGHGFDSVFSMGVLYHQRDPMQHLRQLAACLRRGGEVIVETLIVDQDDRRTLQPARLPGGRYAMMNNVHCIPSCPWMVAGLREAGFTAPRLLDKGATATDEQRATDWMRFHSLANSLHPDCPAKTIEGHPAPMRAIFSAVKP